MALRPIETAADLRPWLPSEYLSTGFTDAIIQTLLDEGNDPRLIAAEVWEEYAGTLSPSEADGGDRTVKAWQNIDVSVQYDSTLSPRDVALRQARFHRSRAKVRSVRLSRPLIEGEAPQEA